MLTESNVQSSLTDSQCLYFPLSPPLSPFISLPFPPPFSLSLITLSLSLLLPLPLTLSFPPCSFSPPLPHSPLPLPLFLTGCQSWLHLSQCHYHCQWPHALWNHIRHSTQREPGVAEEGIELGQVHCHCQSRTSALGKS